MVFKSLDLLLPLFMFWRSNEVVGRSGGTRRAMRVSGHPAGGLRQMAALWARERKGRLGRRRGRCGASGVNHRGGSGGVSCGGHGPRVRERCGLSLVRPDARVESLGQSQCMFHAGPVLSVQRSGAKLERWAL